MMNLFFDSETTGLPPKGAQWSTDYALFPYIVGIAWEHKNVLKDFMVYQEGRLIPKEATAIHGITTKMGNDTKLTTPAKVVYRELIKDCANATNLIGHNLYFDISTAKACIIREFGLDSHEVQSMEEAFHKDKRLDTMRGSISLTKKWPKLTELYALLFPGEQFPAHTAGGDVLATKRCYLELKKRKIM